VDSVRVSLDSGLAVVRFTLNNPATVEQVRTEIFENGFSPKSAEVRLAGRIVERNGSVTLAVPGQDREYALVDEPGGSAVIARLRETAAGKLVEIDGFVPETARRAPRIGPIRVRGFTLIPGR